MISFLDMQRINAPFSAETEEALLRVARSGYYLHGPETKAFQAELAATVGAPQAIGVSNGLDAIRLIFRALIETKRLSSGDAVIVPANTYIATILPLSEFGLRPILIEPDERTLNLDWHKALTQINGDRSVKALFTVHLYGNPSWDNDIARQLSDRNILLIEDNAQAIGSSISQPSLLTGSRFTGALGHAAAFSFYPTKNVGAFGDAGAVTTILPDVSEAVKALANYGSDRRYHNIYCGYNCRIDELQAALLRVRLSHLPQINRQRRNIAAIYNALITNPLVITPQWTSGAVWHQYVIRVKNNNRDAFRQYFLDQGIATDIHYAVPPHRQPCYARPDGSNTLCNTPLPVTEALAAEIVSLPIASVTPAQAAYIARQINSFRP